MKRCHAAFLLVVFAFIFLTGSARAAEAGALRAGAAKVDITPAKSEFPKQFLGILDNLYARVIVVDNGKSKAALVTMDIGVIPHELWATVSQRAEKELTIPAANVLITATHTHSAPMGMNGAGLTEKVFESISQANGKLQPAKMGFGTGVSYLNVQRDRIDPVTHGWWEGANYEGLSDKTVAVIKFVSLAGEPIAVYYNYAMHAVITGNVDLISGDIPGETSKYIEKALGGKAVAVWSEGAAGDQNPVYFQQTYDLRAIRIKDYAKRGIDISNSMPPGGQGLDRTNPEVNRLLDEQKQMIVSMGQMLGEEVLHVTRTTKREVSDERDLL
jgi:neutral ceramidase